MISLSHGLETQPATAGVQIHRRPPLDRGLASSSIALFDGSRPSVTRRHAFVIRRPCRKNPRDGAVRQL